MAQIYVNSGLVKPKSIHIYNSSAQLWEEDKTGYVRVNGEWVPFINYINYIYHDGQEFIPLVQGYKYSSGTIYRNSDHIRINGTAGSSNTSSKNTLVTDDMVDLTEYQSLVIEWSGNGGTAGYAYHHTMVSTQKNISNTKQAIALKSILSSNFEKRTDVIDISTLVGEYFIAIQVDVKEVRMGANTSIYALYLE